MLGTLSRGPLSSNGQSTKTGQLLGQETQTERTITSMQHDRVTKKKIKIVH